MQKRLVDHALALGVAQSSENIDQRDGELRITEFGWPMQNRNGVVALQLSVPVRLVDAADTDHSETVELRGAERPYTRGAIHANAACKGPEDLFVEDRRHILEIAVDQQNSAGIGDRS